MPVSMNEAVAFTRQYGMGFVPIAANIPSGYLAELVSQLNQAYAKFSQDVSWMPKASWTNLGMSWLSIVQGVNGQDLKDYTPGAKVLAVPATYPAAPFLAGHPDRLEIWRKFGIEVGKLRTAILSSWVSSEAKKDASVQFWNWVQNAVTDVALPILKVAAAPAYAAAAVGEKIEEKVGSFLSSKTFLLLAGLGVIGLGYMFMQRKKTRTNPRLKR